MASRAWPGAAPSAPRMTGAAVAVGDAQARAPGTRTRWRCRTGSSRPTNDALDPLAVLLVASGCCSRAAPRRPRARGGVPQRLLVSRSQIGCAGLVGPYQKSRKTLIETRTHDQEARQQPLDDIGEHRGSLSDVEQLRLAAVGWGPRSGPHPTVVLRSTQCGRLRRSHCIDVEVLVVRAHRRRTCRRRVHRSSSPKPTGRCWKRGRDDRDSTRSSIFSSSAPQASACSSSGRVSMSSISSSTDVLARRTPVL